MKAKSRKMTTETLTLGAVLTAMVVILQFMALGIKAAMPFLPFTVSLVLIPIVIGAAKGGPWMGAWLGFVFGVIVLLSGDAAAFLVINPAGTILTVLVKGTICGLAAGGAYRLFIRLTGNSTLATFIAAVVCPVVNTGIFFLGCLLFFMDTVSQWAGDMNVALYMFTGLAGVNFLIELGLNVVLGPVIVRVLKLKKDKV